MIKYEINNHLAYRKIGEYLYIVDSKTSMLHKLNETAGIVFECIKKGLNTEDIIEKITSIYEVEAKEVKADIEQIINEMLKKNIIKIVK